MRMRWIVSVAALIATAAVAGPGPFDGQYLLRDAVDRGLLSCGTVEDWMLMTIDDGFIRDGEVGCRLENPVTVRDMKALLFDARCFAEGHESTHRLLLVKRPGGIGIASGDWFEDLVRCR